MAIIEMKVPVIGESINEVTLSTWLKGNGDYIDLDEPICEFESDKATLEFPAEASGKLIHIAEEGDDLEIGALVAKIDTSAAKPADGIADTEARNLEIETKDTPSTQTTNYATGHPSPAAGKILAEKGIDPSQVSGSGKDGRITKADAQQAIAPAKPTPPQAATSTAYTCP